jgi:hypothetical protein
LAAASTLTRLDLKEDFSLDLFEIWTDKLAVVRSPDKKMFSFMAT